MVLTLFSISIGGHAAPPAFTNRIVAFGDIHADPVVLTTVLRQSGLVDRDLKWSGGTTFAICTGDVLGRGPDSRAVLEILMPLERQAAAAGGKFVVLNGNHELKAAMGDLKYFSEEDMRHYADLPGETLPDKIRGAFRGTGPYAEWIAHNPVIARFGKTLFVHAGIENWIEYFLIDELNDMVKQWLLFFQGLRADAPPVETAWVTGDVGPMWTRKLSERTIGARDLGTMLDTKRVDRVVVGHTITASGLPEVAYDGKLVMIDTGMSIALEDRGPSAVEIVGDRVSAMMFLRPKSVRACGDALATRPVDKAPSRP